MKDIKKIFLLLLLFFLFFPKKTLATSFDLYASTPEPYNRGQEITFTITINTDGATLKNTAIGMTYDTQYLELINTIPGPTFSTITTDNLGNGKLVFYGQSSTGFSGQGKYVDVVFKLIAQAPGSTQLCVLWSPETTPTLQPTTTPKPPQSGDGEKVLILSLIGGTMIAVASLSLLTHHQLKLIKIKKYKTPKEKKKLL